MGRSIYVERMDWVQDLLAARLKAAGFRRSGRTFNRSDEDGIVQVINLQMWPAPIGEAGLLGGDPRYGKFAVNLGVHIAEVHAANFPKPGGTIREMDCAIRARLDGLIGRPDFCWSLKGGMAGLVKPRLDQTAGEVWNALENDGVVFLERFSTRDKIMTGWIDQSPADVSLSRVDIAVMLAARGDTAAAANMLDEHILQVDPRRPISRRHVDSVRELGARLGLRKLVEGLQGSGERSDVDA